MCKTCVDSPIFLNTYKINSHNVENWRILTLKLLYSPHENLMHPNNGIQISSSLQARIIKLNIKPLWVSVQSSKLLLCVSCFSHMVFRRMKIGQIYVDLVHQGKTNVARVLAARPAGRKARRVDHNVTECDRLGGEKCESPAKHVLKTSSRFLRGKLFHRCSSKKTSVGDIKAN